MLAFMFLAPTHPRTPVALVSALVMDFVYLIMLICFGKTKDGEAATLDLNCAGCVLEPDLRTFDPSTHKTILFNEVELLYGNLGKINYEIQVFRAPFWQPGCFGSRD